MNPCRALPMAALLMPLTLAAQDLPLAWPDQPHGTVLFVAHPTLFSGAVAATSDGHWIHAWCDMRDGTGRVFTQKTDPDQPATSGMWHSVIPAWGPVVGLCGPPALITPLHPHLAPDQDGGAFLLWQEETGGESSELRLQRVGDGADGLGAFHWDLPLLLASDVPLPYQDCRDNLERCRGWMDNWRQMVPDGQGGVWVAWRMSEGLRLQHVDAAGVPDPDFPAGGLPLPVTSWGFELVAAGGATLVLHVEEAQPRRLAVLGVGLDGAWLVPEIARPLSVGPVNGYHGCAGPEGDLRVAWSSDEGVRIQRLGSDLAPQWTPAGLPLQSGTIWSVDAVCRTGDGAMAVAWYNSSGAWELQMVDTAGHTAWAQPVSLEVVPDDGQIGEVLDLVVDEAGPAYLVREAASLHLQRVDSDGHQRWTQEVSRLSEPGVSLGAWRLQAGEGGRLRVGLYGLEESTSTQRLRYHLACRDLDGTDVVDPQVSLLLEEVRESCGGIHLLVDDQNPLLAAVIADTLFTQRVDGHSGQRGWGFREHPTAVDPYLEVKCVVPGAAGTWLITSSIVDEMGRTALKAGRVDAEGFAPWPAVLLAPGLLEDYNYFDQYHPYAVAMGGNLVAGWTQFADSLNDVRLQRLDSQGSRLWGEDGLIVPPAATLSCQLLGMATLGGDAVGVLWSERYAGGKTVYLQAFRLDGSRVFPDNNNRGLNMGLDYSNWLSSPGSLLALPDGSVLASTSPWEGDLQHWRLARVAADGTITWRHEEASSILLAAKVIIDGSDHLWLGRTRMDVDRLRFHLERRTMAGELERIWTVDAPDNWYGEDWALTQADGESAVALLDWDGNASQWHFRAHRLPEGDAQPFVDAPTPMVGYAWNAWLREAPQGDVWLVWNDGRGSNLGYGSQIRLTRLDLLPLNTAVEAPARARGFHLEAARPNPFNPATTLAFTLDQAAAARLEVFNLAGQRVRTLWEGPLAAGRHELRFDGRDDVGRELGSGVYLHRLDVDGRRESGRMLLLR